MSIYLAPGTLMSGDDLLRTFQCAPQGGMRRGIRTNSLVLISNHLTSIYHDRWSGNTYLYTGMGLRGNQDINWSQNRTLNESYSNGVDLYLFESFATGDYLFQGTVKLISAPFQEPQVGADGKLRRVWIFPLQLISGSPISVSVKTLEESEKTKRKHAKHISQSELEARAKSAVVSPGTRITTSTVYERDPYVVEYALERAKGVCQLCEKPAPFNDKNGDPFLEVHHIEWLSRGGADSVENAVALCPNCHRKMHILDAEADKKVLIKNVIGR